MFVAALLFLLEIAQIVDGAASGGYKIVGIDLLDVDETTISTGIHQACTIVPENVGNETALTRAKSYDKEDKLALSGSVVCWGDMPDSIEMHPHPTEGGFVQVVSGRTASCGLLETMHVVCWGHKHFSKPPPEETFIQLSAGTDHMCGLKLDGSIRCWGANSNKQASPPSGKRYVQISCGKTHSCAIDIDGYVSCWGRNSRRGEGSPPKGVRFQQISASFDDHTCGVEESTQEDKGELGGRVICWGSNRMGQSASPDGRFLVVTTGRSFSCGIRADSRTIACWGKLRRLKSAEKFSEISAGHSNLCGITSDEGKVRCWKTAGSRRAFLKETDSIKTLHHAAVSVGGSGEA